MMKRLQVIAFVCFFAASATFADVRLVLDEKSILPGTATGLSVVVSNTDAKKPLQLPPTLWLVATNDDFETFSVSAYGIVGERGSSVAADVRMIPPGESRELRYDVSPLLVGSPWFVDGQLSRPGKYRLRAVLAPAVDEDGNFNAPHAIASNEEVLTVETASAEDGEVWAWMEKRGRGGWGQNEWDRHVGDFANFVVTEHPESKYALYAALYAPRREGVSRTMILEEQIKRFPNSPFADQLRLFVIFEHQQAADLASRTDRRKAADAADAGRKLAAEVARNSRSSGVRAAAKKLLDTIPSREAYVGRRDATP